MASSPDKGRLGGVGFAGIHISDTIKIHNKRLEKL